MKTAHYTVGIGADYLMGGACSTDVRNEKYVQNLSQKTEENGSLGRTGRRARLILSEF
jgi:hypothetical protein